MTDIKDTRTLTLEGALKVLNAAIAEATRMEQPMCIAVVDTGGNLRAFGRMDGSKGLSVTSSINKARTSALSGVPTGGAHADAPTFRFGVLLFARLGRAFATCSIKPSKSS